MLFGESGEIKTRNNPSNLVLRSFVITSVVSLAFNLIFKLILTTNLKIRKNGRSNIARKCKGSRRARR
jgi:hypothetical protein